MPKWWSQGRRGTRGPGTHEVERALSEASERYRSLFDYNPHGAFSLDLEGRFIDANPAGRELSGYSLEELRRMHFGELVPLDELPAVTKAFAGVVRRQPAKLETRSQRRDGTVVDIRLTAVPIVVADEVVGVHGVAENVTEANRLRRALEQARRAAVEASSAKSLFLANVSHEVRTPLTSVLAANELLADLELDDPADHLVDMIDRSGQRLLRLVNDLLDFSQLEHSSLELVAEGFGLRRLVSESVLPLTGLSACKGIELVASVDDATPDLWTGDAFRLAQVLGNLLQNAVEFTQQGAVRLVVDTVREGLRFEVVDTGIGIEEEQLEHLFEPFTQADASVTRAHEGAGLGLAICRELVTLMGGRLSASSTPGVGSSFTFVVPLRRA